MRGSKITFILGAGASSAYGFPVAARLRSGLCSEIGIGHPLYLELKILNYRDSDISAFRDQFYYSNNPSIDVFLSKHPEYMDIGKAGIILRLSQNERKDVLGNVKDNWFQYIVRNLIDHDHKIENFENYKVRFISFNYDRSLEELLYGYIRHSFFSWALPNDAMKEIAELVQQIPIVHIYGRFDDLDWESDGGRAYGDKAKLFMYYKKIAERIELMRDGVMGEKLSKRVNLANSFVADSDFVVILGFGFDLLNFQLLGINNNFRGKKIFACGFGLLPAQQNSIMNMFEPEIRSKVCIGNSDFNCETFLKQSIEYI